MKETFILRDFLAIERTTLANERTLFSYVRSALYLSLGGIALLQLRGFDNMNWLAFVVFGISIFMLIFGVIRYQILQKKLNKFYNDLMREQTNQDNFTEVDTTNKSSKL